MEVHDEPGRARSDAGNALRLDRLEALILKLKRIAAVVREDVAAGASTPGGRL
jgi:3-deoxy-D-manno-octulosonic acid (KDO) 8-phosphate synthase